MRINTSTYLNSTHGRKTNQRKTPNSYLNEEFKIKHSVGDYNYESKKVNINDKESIMRIAKEFGLGETYSELVENNGDSVCLYDVPNLDEKLGIPVSDNRVLSYINCNGVTEMRVSAKYPNSCKKVVLSLEINGSKDVLSQQKTLPANNDIIRAFRMQCATLQSMKTADSGRELSYYGESILYDDNSNTYDFLEFKTLLIGDLGTIDMKRSFNTNRIRC